jgi:hypothetical protein
MPREYAFEDGKSVDLTKLTADRMPLEPYKAAHKGLVIPCHDVMIEYEGGLLLVNRHIFPAIGVLWPVGGRLSRGEYENNSLSKIAFAECSLKLEEPIINLGHARTFFQTDPFEHGHGTDTRNTRHFARGRGTLKLNKDHSKPIIVKPEDYTKEFREGLELYVQHFIDLAMPMIGKSTEWLLETQGLLKDAQMSIITRDNQ